MLIYEITRNSISHLAARSKSLKVLEQVLDCDKIDINDTNDDGETALHTLSKYVPKSFDTDLLRLMLKRGADPTRKDDNGAIPLHYCAATGKYNWCSLLLKQKGVNINELDNKGESPIHYATRYVQNKAVGLFIKEGADVTIKGKEGTPLQVLYKRREEKWK